MADCISKLKSKYNELKNKKGNLNINEKDCLNYFITN